MAHIHRPTHNQKYSQQSSIKKGKDLTTKTRSRKVSHNTLFAVRMN